MSVAIRYDLSRDDLTPGLAGLLAAAGDLTPAMDEIGVELVAATVHRFETETGPDGQRWKPSYRALTEGGQTLSLRGHLRDSNTHRPGSNWVEWGSNLIYAGVHQRGDTIRAKNAKALRFQIGGQWAMRQSVTIPRRQFLGVDDADLEMIREVLVEHVAAGAEGAGGAA